jgi:hypothetical protein
LGECANARRCIEEVPEAAVPTFGLEQRLKLA